MDLSRLITNSAVYKEAKFLAESKGKTKSFEQTHRYICKRNNDFYKYLKDQNNLIAFCEALKNYKISSYTGFALYKGVDSKGQKKYRPLLIPCHQDRLLFSIINKILFPLFEKHMKRYDCLGIGLTKYERKISSGPVIKEIIALNTDGYTHVLKTDFKRFFCTIPRKRLLQKVKKIIASHEEHEVLYELVKQSLYNNITSNDNFKKAFSAWQLDLRGVPQGLSYSSLLASLYGTILDNAISELDDVKYKRYLDDMVILGKNEQAISVAYLKLKEVSKKIGLDLHDVGPVTDGKTFMVNSVNDPYIFIGIEVHNGIARIPEKAIKRFKSVIEQEIINTDTIAKYQPNQIKEVFENYTYGWKKAYSSVVSPDHFTSVILMLNEYLNDYLNKKRKSALSGYVFNL